MTAREVGSVTESAQWAQIEDIDGRAGVFQFRVAGRRRALTTSAVSAIPNYFVFLTLAVYLRESSISTG
jgi:SH3-like domain-containing protein